MIYEINITRRALADMEAIYEYIAYDLMAPANALAQYDRIAEAILKLEEFPERFRLVQFEKGRSIGLRQMIVDHYSVFYLIKENQVVVTNVLYSASDLEKRLQ